MKEVMFWVGPNLFFLIISIFLVVGIIIYVEIFRRACRFWNEEKNKKRESENKDERYNYK